MDMMTDIARDYLADFEVLTEARMELDDQLEKWWRVLLPKHVQPALQELNRGAAPVEWDNKSSPGLCHYRVTRDHPLILQLTDPRSSQRGCYTVTLLAQSQPTLKSMARHEALVNRLNGLAREQGIGDESGLKWAKTELASADIEIQADAPEATLRRVGDTAARCFKLIIEHRHMTSEGTGAANTSSP